MMFLFMMNWLFSFMFLFLNHPLSLGCILLCQTILISLMTGYFYLNFWFGYILFLVMIGGMLVMFIYMTSIASNEKFSFHKFLMVFFIAYIFMMMVILIFMDEFYSLSANIFTNFNQSYYFKNFSLNKFYNYPNMQMMVLLMIYLLVTLIAVVKITGNNFGTLRQK